LGKERIVSIEQIDITLCVPSLEETQAWYRDVLGWNSGCDARNETGECLYGDVYYSRDPLVGFNLSKSADSSNPVGFYPLIKVPDVDELYKELQGKDVEIIQPPVENVWGKNFRIEDLNGFILEFWSEVG